MGRPADWSPLADSDPIGGDVHLASAEAQYYSGIADEIRDQVTRLHAIAGNHDQVGKTADKLREKASSSADAIAKTHKRVAAVGEALTSWIPHLETAQRDTATALRQAKDAAYRQGANAAPPAGSPKPKSEGDKSAAAARANRLSEANGDLAAARKKFDSAVAERDTQAKRIASTIHDGLNDGLNDSWWDSFSDWVSSHVKMIKLVVEVLSWVATAVAIVALFIPGLNILAAALLVTVLLGHTMLAATGNGSWTDVAFDVIGLASFGFAGFAGKTLEAGRAATLARGGELAAADASRSVNAVRAATQDSMLSDASLFKPSTWGKALYAKSGLFKTVTDFKAAASASKAESAVLERELPQVTKMESFLGDGKDLAQHAKDLKALRAIYGGDPEFDAQAARWGSAIRVQRGAALTGQSLDTWNHLASRSDIPWAKDHVLVGVPQWNHFKEITTLGIS